MELPSFLPETWKPWWERLVKWAPITVAIVVGIGTSLAAIDQIAKFFGLSGEKPVNIDIQDYTTVLNSSYEKEGDVVVAAKVHKTGRKTAINCRFEIHADGRPLIVKATNYGEKFSLPAGEVLRDVDITVTPFKPPARRWREIHGSIICDDGIASEEVGIVSKFLWYENFQKK